MGNVTEYLIYNKEKFYLNIKSIIPNAKIEDTNNILLAFGLELIDGRVFILKSENYRESLSPSYQLNRAIEDFYEIDYFDVDSDVYEYIWPWRDRELILEDLKLSKSKSLIDRKYLLDD